MRASPADACPPGTCRAWHGSAHPRIVPFGQCALDHRDGRCSMRPMACVWLTMAAAGAGRGRRGTDLRDDRAWRQGREDQDRDQVRRRRHARASRRPTARTASTWRSRGSARWRCPSTRAPPRRPSSRLRTLPPTTSSSSQKPDGTYELQETVAVAEGEQPGRAMTRANGRGRGVIAPDRAHQGAGAAARHPGRRLLVQHVARPAAADREQHAASTPR